MDAYRQVYEQFFEEASFLWGLRSIAVNEPHYTLQDLSQLEQRIAANLDGLMTSIEDSWEICRQRLEEGQAEDIFVAAVIAFRSHDIRKIQLTVQAGLDNTASTPGLTSAMGWLPPALVHEWIKKFLHSKDLGHKYLAICACSVRRENPGNWLNRILEREDCITHPLLYQRSLRLIGELRRRDLAQPLADAIDSSQDDESRFWALWSQILLGHRNHLQQLEPYVLRDGPLQIHAMGVLLRALPIDQSHALISKLAKAPSLAREVVIGSGMLGDPHAVNWLVGRMLDPSMARIAGEAFTSITGVDLEQQVLTSDPPASLPTQPNDDADDEDVSMDADENLPWPNAEKLKAYWETHGSQFISGQRYLSGRPINAAALKEMLPGLNMRQRHRAALEIALIDAAAPYINTQAKAGDYGA